MGLIRRIGLKKKNSKYFPAYFLALMLVVSTFYIYLQYSHSRRSSKRRLQNSDIILKISNTNDRENNKVNFKRIMDTKSKMVAVPIPQNGSKADNTITSEEDKGKNTVDIITRESNDKSGSCREPVMNIVLTKSHRTGASTLSSIILRYAYRKDLSYAFLKDTSIKTNNEYSQYFSRNMVDGIHTRRFNVLLTEGRFNKEEADAVVVDKPVYLAIVREPKDQFESAFAFYDIAKRIHITDYPDPVGRFLTLSKTYFTLNARNQVVYALRNWQISDLGLGPEYQSIDHVVDYKLKQLSYELDLVLIAEYFDQSLVLLKNLLCWSWDDLVYVAQNMRKGEEKYSMTNYTESLLLQYNSADYKLYRYFNQTLWEKIKNYDGNFQADLEHFRARLNETLNTCTDASTIWDRGYKVFKPALKKDADWNCTLTWMGHVGLKRLIAEKTESRQP